MVPVEFQSAPSIPNYIPAFNTNNTKFWVYFFPLILTSDGKMATLTIDCPGLNQIFVLSEIDGIYQLTLKDPGDYQPSSGTYYAAI